MLKISIAPANAGIVSSQYKIEETTSRRGFDKKLKIVDDWDRVSYLEMYTGPAKPFYMYIVEEFDKEYYMIFTDAATDSIVIDSVDIYNKNNGEKIRTLKSDRLLKNYKYCACLIHGILKNNDFI